MLYLNKELNKRSKFFRIKESLNLKMPRMNLVSDKPWLGPDPDSLDAPVPQSSALYTVQHFVCISKHIAQLLALGLVFSVISKQPKVNVPEVVCEIEMKWMGFEGLMRYDIVHPNWQLTKSFSYLYYIFISLCRFSSFWVLLSFNESVKFALTWNRTGWMSLY